MSRDCVSDIKESSNNHISIIEGNDDPNISDIGTSKSNDNQPESDAPISSQDLVCSDKVISETILIDDKPNESTDSKVFHFSADDPEIKIVSARLVPRKHRKRPRPDSNDDISDRNDENSQSGKTNTKIGSKPTRGAFKTNSKPLENYPVTTKDHKLGLK